MKKILALLLALILLTSALVGCSDMRDNSDKTETANCEDGTSDIPEAVITNTPKNPEEETTESTLTESPISDFEYEVNEDGGITITKYIGSASTVFIPSKIAGKDVARLGDLSFAHKDLITQIIIPNTITTIHSGVFMYCWRLTTVKLSSNLTSIGRGAFDNCTSLSNITLPDSLTTIEYAAFQKCSSLKSIRIPSNVVLEGMVFANSGLEEVSLGEGIEIIYSNTFAHTKLQEIVLPSTVREICSFAFESCHELQKITLNEGLKRIEDNAFRRNTKLTEIEIPTTVEFLSEYAFLQSDNLTAIKFKGNAPSEFLCQDEALNEIYSYYSPTFIIYYHAGAEGFTSPEWNGFPAQLW